MSDGIETIRNADAGDVAVRKTIETGDDDTATVTLEVTAHREEPLFVQLTEPALADVPTDDIDLHGEDGAGHWRLDDEAVFERRFDGRESCTTVYRVWNVDEERFRHIDADPEIEVEADAPGDLDDVVDREGSEVVRRLIEGRADSLTDDEIVDGEAETDTDGRPAEPGDRRPEDGAEEVGAGADDQVVGAERSGTSAEAPNGIPGTSDGIEAAASDPTDASDASADRSGGIPGAAGSGEGMASGDGAAAALLAELKAGDVEDEVASELRDELRVGKSHDVRIGHLQRQVGDLAAYVDVLESFIDEHGTFEEAFGDLASDVEGVDEDVAALGDDLEALSGRVTDVVDDLQGNLAAFEEEQDGVLDRVETVETEQATVEERLDEIESFADRLSGVFQRVGADGDQ